MVALTTLIAAALLIVVSVLVACSDEHRPPPASTATSTPTPTPRVHVVITQPTPRWIPPTRTPTPSPTATPYPEAPNWVVWTPQQTGDSFPKELEGPGKFLLDLESGLIYHPNQGRIISWTEFGEPIILAERPPADGSGSGYYAGRPGGALRLLPEGIDIVDRTASPDGALRFEIGGDTSGAIFDTETGRLLLVLPSRRWYTGVWSPDGHFLIIESYRSDPDPVILLWSRADLTQIELLGFLPTWSNHGHRFTYATGTLVSDESYVMRLYDPDLGESLELGKGSGRAVWSPNDLFVSLLSRHDGYAFRLVEPTSGKTVLTVNGSWFGGWLNDDTFYFTGNVCDSFDFFTADIDGSDLRQLTDYGRYTGQPAISPDRSKIVHDVQDGRTFVTEIIDIISGTRKQFEVGWLVSAGRYGFDPWSPDGRYVQLTFPGGRDGPCFPVPTPQTTTITPGG